MLARPELGTREHILLWLARKDPTEKYEYELYEDCACGQYAREALGKSNLWWATFATFPAGAPLRELNYMASGHKTFGALYDHVRKRWHRD